MNVHSRFLHTISPIFKREFSAYFATPLAYVFIVIFLFTMGAFTFYVGHFYENGIADLSVFFAYHPWLYLFLVPAIAMRLWADERRTGTMELLLTLPVPLWATVVGKYLAAWAFTGIALFLTFPIWLTVNFLGQPDNGVILASYIGSFLVAGGYLAIGACMSATTNNQVIAFVVSVVVCFLFTVSGSPLVLDVFRAWAPDALVEAVASFSFVTHFTSITQGVLDLRDLVFFFSLIALFLAANVVVVDLKKGG
ncbi:ABC transporter permease [Rhizomicrobium electricum]|uniref:ABC transporter permease subunit n=1 Tax=Rhizomicrobium electricum TaxID=480070 RepID=A0ABN1E4K1_9PROT|nr:ABC transporter permease [Rhizomicrobium electricum]NIJ47636.1 ABC-2 type transport system permease protein [Rhizomicrobium electricum]